MLVALLIPYLIAICVFSTPDKVSLENECKYNDLESGTYKVILPASGYSFYVYCLVDGTMYINPGQQALYHFHNQHSKRSITDDLVFKLKEKANYHDASDIIDQHEIDLESATNIDDDDTSDETTNEDEEDDDDDDTLSSSDIELSSAEKATVNKTAQYIVYAVIIIMAIIFSFGICLLMYWWCCHTKKPSLMRVDDSSSLMNNNEDEITETVPFIDIRSESTIAKQKCNKRAGKTIYIGTNSSNDSNVQQRNVYDDIDDAEDEKEDGDELIADYGATTNSSNKNNHRMTGYVIKPIPQKNELLP